MGDGDAKNYEIIKDVNELGMSIDKLENKTIFASVSFGIPTPLGATIGPLVDAAA